jgi:metal-responsive CopG/Arc/MetJ family transcriptional regulator
MKKRFSISLEEDILKQVQELAEKEGRNLSNMIEYIIRQYLADK